MYNKALWILFISNSHLRIIIGRAIVSIHHYLINLNKFLLNYIGLTTTFMINLQSHGKFMLCIGEEGIILLYFRSNSLNKRYFVKDRNSEEIANIKSCLAADKKAPIYLVLNNQEQSYILHTFPRMDRLSIYLAVKAKIECLSQTYDINAALPIKKISGPSRSYLFVSSKAKHLIEYWLCIMAEMGSNFKGILMFPIEMGNIAKKVLPQDCNNWKIIVSFTKTGGYRQVVLRNNKIILTRLVPSTNSKLPGIIAGAIYQEVKNTIHSLFKFDFKQEDLIDLCIIVSEEIKASLAIIKFSENSVNILTPYELSKALKLEIAISEKDKFCDTTVLFYSFQDKPEAIFHSKESRKFYLLNSFFINSPRIFFALALILIIVNIFCFVSLYSNHSTIDALYVREQVLNSQLEELTQNYNTKKIDRFYDLINISNALSKIECLPFHQIKQAAKLKIPSVKLQAFSWLWETNSAIMNLSFDFQNEKNVLLKYKELKSRLENNFRTEKFHISDLASTLSADFTVNVKIEER